MASDPHYFDTNPFVDWAEWQVGEGGKRAQSIGKEVERILSNPKVDCACSELTVIEYYSTICKHWRSTEPDKAVFDANWGKDAISGCMSWLAEGRLVVLETAPRVVETAISWVIAATEDFGRALSANDAVHLSHAIDWARQLNQRVTVVTSDKGFERIMEAFPSFQRYVTLKDLSAGM